MIAPILKKLFGNHNERQLKQLSVELKQIKATEADFAKLSDPDLQQKFTDWRQQLSLHPDQLESELFSIFAAIREACRRLQGKEFPVNDKPQSWDMVPYDVQLMGGLVLHRGNIAEMKTGEGKTLVCTLPVIANALCEKGVHVVTVNDYLAHRDAEWMKPLYEFCGLSVGTVVHGLSKDERRLAYQADITYGTNNEFGFDYLRDNMAQDEKQLVQRGHCFAIVDEVDSILIDEARTPLIISAPAEESVDKYQQYSQIIPHLIENEDYNIDIQSKQVTLTEDGIAKVEQKLGVKNLFTEAGFSEVHHLEQALKARAIMKRDQDYVVREDKIMIVDEFTGRLMPGRRFSDGLHQALEAKEQVPIQRESKTLATITFQNYFRLYSKLSGMTGTAETEAEEFAKIYKLDTLVIPTNQNLAREDRPDLIFKSEKGKFLNLAKTVKELYEKGQPVLIGTVHIEKSEVLSQLLSRENVPHEVLNAKNHAREAEIVSKAGHKQAVTIATNMAGRGTDIKLGEGVRELGGLAILGTERHESRRIDNQLRGRAGRQGDPGFSQFYVAMNDELMKRFGGEKLGSMMDRVGVGETECIENRMISRSVENAQKRIEGFYFDARKHIVQYDDIINIHREKIYTRRRKLLGSESILEDIQNMITELSQELTGQYLANPERDQHWNLAELTETITAIKKDPNELLDEDTWNEFSHQSDIREQVSDYFLRHWQEKRDSFPAEIVDKVTRQVVLRSVDHLWLEHINQMTHLRERVALSGYAQKDPIMEYKREAYKMFVSFLNNIRRESVANLFRVEFRAAPQFIQRDPAQLNTNQQVILGQIEGSPANDSESNQPLSRAERRRKQK